ncbi:glutamate-1-semialdehyde-2,1-aminomutase [PVC group bacterium (ex Bugula neritina AB1)]|nr:glutamate-1-semialdehyde-2,1-aminomutase [PVC group bacterium (ex Bugula neritina AB1)]
MKDLFQRAKKSIPGGVNSPVRSLSNVNGTPVFMKSSSGALIYDNQNTPYVDFCQSWGSMILGHSHPEVIQEIQQSITRGTSFGCATELEIQMAEKLISLVPSLEQVRCVNSGTEATMSAIRLARGFTGRDIIIKFDGCYHGHVDHLLISCGSGVTGAPSASSKGVPPAVIKDVISLPYNDTETVSHIFQEKGSSIAAIIVEPVAANMGLIPPKKGFLESLRSLCTQHGSLLIFDEVISGFRLAKGGAQEFFGVHPDLTCLGKIIGGGFPVGAFGGSTEIMEHLAPCGHVYQAGTLSGNPIAMTAGLKTLELIGTDAFYEKLNNHAKEGLNLIQKGIKSCNVPITLQSLGSMFSFFISKEAPENFASVHNCDHKAFANFYQKSLAENIYLSPSGYETNFITFSHTKNHFESLAKVISSLNI